MLPVVQVGREEGNEELVAVTACGVQLDETCHDSRAEAAAQRRSPTDHQALVADELQPAAALGSGAVVAEDEVSCRGGRVLGEGGVAGVESRQMQASSAESSAASAPASANSGASKMGALLHRALAGRLMRAFALWHLGNRRLHHQIHRLHLSARCVHSQR